MRLTRLSVLLATAVLMYAGAARAQQAGANADTGTKAPNPVQVNLNTASAPELESLPGVGPALAARIVEYRQKNGAFKKIEDLMNVKGIGEKQFLKLKPRLSVGPAKPAAKPGGTPSERLVPTGRV